ncbi:S-phase kinase-associated protein 1-like protein [Gracilaria domingensis]|nr:S-phase kinase-associated protein 1-like protein [Gracilaria domingensis]
MQINFVKGMLEDVDEVDGMEIPMGEVEAAILAKVVEYCRFHYQQELNQTSGDEVDRWERSFVQVDKSTLFQLILPFAFPDYTNRARALAAATTEPYSLQTKGRELLGRSIAFGPHL